MGVCQNCNYDIVVTCNLVQMSVYQHSRLMRRDESRLFMLSKQIMIQPFMGCIKVYVNYLFVCLLYVLKADSYSYRHATEVVQFIKIFARIVVFHVHECVGKNYVGFEFF